MSFREAREALNHLFHRRADNGLDLPSPVTMQGMLALVAELVDILNGIVADRPIWQRRFEPLVFKDQTPSEPVQPFVCIICNELRFEALASRQEVWMRLARSGEDMSHWARSASLVHDSATLVLLCTPGLFEDPAILPSLQTAYSRNIPIMPAIANAIYNAVGVRVDEVPIIPEKIFQGLQKLKSGKNGKSSKAVRIGPTKFPKVKFPEPIHVEPPV